MTWVLLVGGPKNGQRYDMTYVGVQVRYPEDDEDGGRYVLLGSSGDRGDILYTWHEGWQDPHEACVCGHERLAHGEGCVECGWDCTEFRPEPHIDCPHCGVFHDAVCRFPDDSIDKRAWTRAERDSWREQAKRLNPAIRFAPSSENFQARFGKRNREERAA